MLLKLSFTHCHLGLSVDWRGAVPSLFDPSCFHRCWVSRYSWDHVQKRHEMWRRHPQGLEPQHRYVGGKHHVPFYRWTHTKRDRWSGGRRDENSGNLHSLSITLTKCPATVPQWHHVCLGPLPPWEEVLGVDRWLHPGLSDHLPADVDQQTGVRRGRTSHRPQEVLLSSRQSRSWVWKWTEDSSTTAQQYFTVIMLKVLTSFRVPRTQVWPKLWCSLYFVNICRDTWTILATISLKTNEQKK